MGAKALRSKAAGRVVDGFSKPYIATYSFEGDVVDYKNGTVLARGISVNMEPEVTEQQEFHADNKVAETSKPKFKKGNGTVKVDGLLPTAEKMLRGLPEADVDGFVHYAGEEANFVGFGYIIRFISGSVRSFVPFVYKKCTFAMPKETAETENESLNYQPAELSFTAMRDDSAAGEWKMVGAEYATEAEAEAALKKVFKIV